MKTSLSSLAIVCARNIEHEPSTSRVLHVHTPRRSERPEVSDCDSVTPRCLPYIVL